MPQQNNFGMARLLFAAAVVALHVAALAPRELGWAVAAIGGVAAVPCFFVISGFLVTMSWDRSHSGRDYAVKRLRRIAPAYIAVILLTAVLLPASNAGAYVAANLTTLNFLQPTLEGWFTGNRDIAVNGSLWSIKVELMFYASVPVMALLVRRHGAFPVLAMAYLASALFRASMDAMFAGTGDRIYLSWGQQLPGQGCYFAAGAAIYYCRDAFMAHRWFLFALAAPVYALGWWWQLPVIYPAALAVTVMALCLSRPVSGVGNRNDYSYGLYLVHFPIIQSLVAVGLPQTNVALYVAASLALTALAAFALWHLVEKPALRFRFQRGGSLVSA